MGTEIEKIRLKTPAAKCMWAKLSQPAPDFKGDHMEYSVSLVFTPEEADILPFKATLNKMLSDAITEAKGRTLNPATKSRIYSKPWCKEQVKSKTYEPTGLYEMKFKTRADIEDKTTKEKKRITIPVFDAAKQRIEPVPEMANDSILKVSFTPMPYFVESSGEVGINLYLNAVQVIKLIPWNGADADDFGFGEESGGYIAETPTTEGNSYFGGNEPMPADNRDEQELKFDDAPF